MKKMMKVISTIVLSLIVIGAVPTKSELPSDNFDFIENQIKESSEFIQNGIKVEYSVSQPISKEISRIEKYFNLNFHKNVQTDGNSIIYDDSTKQIKALVWSDNENTKVQIIYINNDKNANTFHLKKELNQMQNIAAKNIKYFNFIKVKIIEERKQNLLEILKNNIDKDTLEIMDIHNGSVGKANLYDGNKVNIGFVKYDTGEYLVIGTPVIFITY
ncbi:MULTISPECIES: hypothetical protein [Clostridium]|jgi:hypothetical protein|uniref:TATA-box binding protein n=2 Tax=root TaxID=1 RepID=R9BVZ8_9CLOT|nr:MULTISPECIES: hypothetical protein [Clostridium]EOR21304.1 hypothetical protein A500_13730 [Clostridium sartagoforme AAU1]KLE17011.1 hypothetical protein AAT22_03215 [Clostridium sp. C8]